MPDHREFRHDIEVGNYRESWRSTSIAPVREAPEVVALRAAHEDWLNIASAQFLLSVDLALSWYIGAGALEKTPFFFDFFSHPAVAAALPGLAPLPETVPPEHLGFEREKSWYSIARLASYMGSGPINGPSGLSDDQLVPLIRNFEQAAFRGAYSEALCYHSNHRWSPWFEGYRNSSLWMIDKASGLVTVMLITDAD